MNDVRLDGSSFTVRDAKHAVQLFRRWIWTQKRSDNLVPDLRDKNLADWCRLCPAHRDGKPFDVDCRDCDPCHADVLGRIANA